MKIGLTQITARNEFSFPETLQVCREAGYEAIEPVRRMREIMGKGTVTC